MTRDQNNRFGPFSQPDIVTISRRVEAAPPVDPAISSDIRQQPPRSLQELRSISAADDHQRRLSRSSFDIRQVHNLENLQKIFSHNIDIESREDNFAHHVDCHSASFVDLQ